MPKCVNCGQHFAKNEGYTSLVFSTMSFCSEACADEYKEKHPSATKFGSFMLKINMVVLLVILLVLAFGYLGASGALQNILQGILK